MALRVRRSRSLPAVWRRAAWAALALAVLAVALRELSPRRQPDFARANQTPTPTSEIVKRASPAVIDLPADAWDGVRDDTVFRGAEHETFYRLLAQLSRRAPDSLRAASQGRAGFLPLSQQMDSYRGQVVTVEGIARRALAVKAEPNDFGIDKLFQVWIRPVDTAAGPIVVYCLDLPGGFPLGNDIEAPVELDAVAFKRWAYRATDGTRTAPLLLARTLRWDATPSGSPRVPRELPNWPLVLGAAAALSASAVFWIWFTAPRRRRPRTPERLAP